MKSIVFPWLSDLLDEQAYEFLGEVIEAANAAGTHTAFRQTLDALVVEWRDEQRSPSSLARSSP
ncbi:hypothetical protein [Streptomyces olivochromogenes]|uniref:Uncharacterized protein n=1 Tax=Streptomyces olivochromogenes TaxID=1963 RepID=A0A250VP12_STROL|nr:hypothetical protein [Streptomyces olivochromogenes]GAX55782.1 hypothetical protein SO3561_07344 [Streptomyces olivochromogenes]